MFCILSGAHFGAISRIWSEFGPGPIQDFKSYSFVLLKVASVRAQRALGAFGSLKKVASLRDPCPESSKIVGYIFYFMPRSSQDGRLRRPFWEVLGMRYKV